MLLSVGLFIVFTACMKQEMPASKVVNLSTWSNYVDQELLKEFEAQTGIKVNLSIYSSNEELLAKIQAGASGIDVAIPSDYMVEVMQKLNLLSEMDLALIPNKELVNQEFLKQSFDPGNKYSLPYAWSTAGIAVNRDLYKGVIKSWKDVFLNPALKGKLSFLDDVREVTAAALKMHGFSVNTTTPSELKLAEATLVEVKPRVKMFRSDTVEALLKKEVAVAHSYSSDALQAARTSGGVIEYILPEDGGTRALDNLVILKGHQNREGAHQLINFLLSLKANVSFVKTVLGGPVLKTTRQELPAEIQNNRSLFPSNEQLARFESIIDLGEATGLYDKLWTKIKVE
ncbi:MAG: hypothetical protein A2X86_10800 [Bdellovibrionales bacterium GWA2_49_15]|nr:MAG: hypothetical protein A2X86_10800 [Bdellovibrionales bacterium GWA2_49_15]